MEQKGGQRRMKIIVNKHEYAALVRKCAKLCNNTDCDYCLLAGLCEGYEFMEIMCEIVEDEE